MLPASTATSSINYRVRHAPHYLSKLETHRRREEAAEACAKCHTHKQGNHTGSPRQQQPTLLLLQVVGAVRPSCALGLERLEQRKRVLLRCTTSVCYRAWDPLNYFYGIPVDLSMAWYTAVMQLVFSPTGKSDGTTSMSGSRQSFATSVSVQIFRGVTCISCLSSHVCRHPESQNIT